MLSTDQAGGRESPGLRKAASPSPGHRWAPSGSSLYPPEPGKAPSTGPVQALTKKHQLMTKTSTQLRQVSVRDFKDIRLLNELFDCPEHHFPSLRHLPSSSIILSYLYARTQGCTGPWHRLCTARRYGPSLISDSFCMTHLEVVECTTCAAVDHGLPPVLLFL